jgi:hypothetical protein
MSEISLIEGKLLERAQMKFGLGLKKAIDNFIKETDALFPSMNPDEAKETAKWLRERVTLRPQSFTGGNMGMVRYECENFLKGDAPDLPEELSRALLRQEVSVFLASINKVFTAEEIFDSLRERGVKV